MPTTIAWTDIAIRLLLTAMAGGVIGLDRDEHGRPAGLRTNMLVGLAAAIAMILANLLMATTGKGPASFVNIDPMRLPLGVLSGIGFIGAGAILRRDNLVLGVTTAATVWFVTIVGLCFGAGHLGLGLTAFLSGTAVLVGLKRVERHIKQDRHAVLSVTMEDNSVTDEELSSLLSTAGYTILNWSVTYNRRSGRRKVVCELRWHGSSAEYHPPALLEPLARRTGVVTLSWKP